MRPQTLHTLGYSTRQIVIQTGRHHSSIARELFRNVTEYKPYYTFDEVQKLVPGEIYPLDIEIWDSAIVLGRGHRLILEIGSQSQSGCFMMEIGDDRIWDADVTIYTGGKFQSYLLLPVIPSYADAL